MRLRFERYFSHHIYVIYISQIRPKKCLLTSKRPGELKRKKEKQSPPPTHTHTHEGSDFFRYLKPFLCSKSQTKLKLEVALKVLAQGC